MFWNREEVFMSLELEKYAKAKEILDANGIHYKVNAKSSNINRDTRTMGGFGVQQKYNTTYYIYTDKNVAEQARYLIRKGLFT